MAPSSASSNLLKPLMVAFVFAGVLPSIPRAYLMDYRVRSQDSTGSEYRALASLPVESCELTLQHRRRLQMSLGESECSSGETGPALTSGHCATGLAISTETIFC